MIERNKNKISGLKKSKTIMRSSEKSISRDLAFLLDSIQIYYEMDTIWHAKAYQGMPRHQRHAKACQGMACHALACHGMPRHAMPCLDMPWHALAFHILSNLYKNVVFVCKVVEI